MKDIYLKIVELFETNRFAVLATLISVSGSSPRNPGTKMLVMDDGSFVGTVGGGALEAWVLEEAKKVLMSGFPLRINKSFDDGDSQSGDMACGGNADVYLEPVSPDNLNHLYLFKKLKDITCRGGSGLLATVINAELWRMGQIPKMFIGSDGDKTGSLLGIEEIESVLIARINEFLAQGKPGTMVCRDEEGNQLDLFVEPITSDPILYLFGGGHISSELVPLANRVGFKVEVIDDRPEFAEKDNFPDAADVHHCPFEGVMKKVPIDESSFIIIMTRGHSHDKTVLAQALNTNAKYVGMIGSKRKRSIIYSKLLEEGVTQETLDRVHSPIGIEINAETPEEIAVSIVAELIKVRSDI